MEGMVLSLLTVLWMMGVMGQQNIVYVSQSLSWTDARDYCRKHYIDLVTVKSIAENAQIKKKSWLGLYRGNAGNWMWTSGDAPLTYLDVNVFISTSQISKNCVYKQDGKWRDDDCTAQHEFYCLDDSLFLVISTKTWEEALVHCRSLSSGQCSYTLASIITDEDHDFVKSKISGMVWTGLRFLGDRWVWVGGEEVRYDNITSCPRDKPCGGIDKLSSENYTVANCEEKRDFFCYRKPTAL